jgi:hypothetical protein
MGNKLTCAIAMAVGLVLWCSYHGTAHATPAAPTDYFVDASTSVFVGVGYGNDNSTENFLTNTGSTAGPIAQSTNPNTILYYDNGYNNTSGTVVATGNASALADLSTASLHAAAGLLSGTGSFSASARAVLGDTLYFTNTSASSSTLTTVNFSVHVDGTVYDSVALSVALGDSDVIGSVPSLYDFAPTAPGCSSLVVTDCVYNNGTASFTAGSGSGGPMNDIDQTLNGTFSFMGQTASVLLFMSLAVDDQLSYTDFYNTTTLSFDTLPTGVSYTSASGDFLAGSPTSVPEPTSIIMLATGLVGLTFVQRWNRA